MLSTILLLCAQAETPAADPVPEGLKQGARVKVTTAQDALTGTVQSTTDPNFVRLRVSGTGETVAVRRSAIQTVRFLADEGAPGGTTLPNRHLVYVHGICKHSSGFWRPWWAAMKQYTPQIAESNIHEVVWSDIVNAPGAATATATDEEKELDSRIRAILEDRELQEASRSGADQAAEEAPGGVIDDFFGCTDDFVQYMTRSGVRTQILNRFTQVVRPLLEQGAEVEIISHSWGTVVAYEGLRNLDGQTQLTGRVHNLFTVGSALSIGPVKQNLSGRVSGGAKPRAVARWVNIDAAYDPVGGHIRNAPFQVDVERLDMPAVGCFFIATPTCAHGSYFNKDNVAVNRDIFGFFIGQ
ncbi:MAG: hypothetical protein U0835_13295 [Isosphaeraceae bacterium]